MSDPTQVQVPQTTQTGGASATGAAIEAKTKEVPQGEDRGSKAPIVGVPQADTVKPKPQGAQAQPAQFTSNGQIPHGFVASPAGAVPASLVAKSPEHAKELTDAAIEQHKKALSNTDRALSEAEVSRMSRAELVAVAAQRGYNVPQAGSRVTREAFLFAQKNDPKFQGQG